MTTIKALILAAILAYASIKDLQSHEVPDSIPLMTAILALVNVQATALPAMLFGAVAVFLPQIIVSVMNPAKTIGGADIKLMTAVGFLLGANRGLFALALGLILAVATMSILRLAKTAKIEPFPLVPFLSVGIIAAYFI